MAAREILLLGDTRLYERCAPVNRGEADSLAPVVEDLRDTLLAFRAKYGAGRGIAAPQIGVQKRIVYLHFPRPMALFNPVLETLGTEQFELWDDCMCFPDLLVKVCRHRRCRVSFRDAEWAPQALELEDDLSELLQHEVDHLDGVLAIQRAIDSKSFALRAQRRGLQ